MPQVHRLIKIFGNPIPQSVYIHFTQEKKSGAAPQHITRPLWSGAVLVNVLSRVWGLEGDKDQPGGGGHRPGCLV